VPEGLLHETKEEWPVSVEDALLGQTLQRQFARGHDQGRVPSRYAGPQAALLHVCADRRREEEFSLRVTDYRLVRPQ
jgi:hypothetical protein